MVESAISTALVQRPAVTPPRPDIPKVGGAGDRWSRTSVWAAITVLGVLAGYAAVLLANARHFYTDDSESQYVPMWVMFGRALWSGHLPLLQPDQWMTGNYTQEEAGLLNPPQLLVDLISPAVGNLAVLATVVKLAFSIIAALGVFRICLVYRARPHWAALAGVAFPLTGWFLFFDEASWYTALTGTAWLVHAWASGVRYLRGRTSPLPVFIFLYLAISVEYAFPPVEAVLMLVVVAIGELVYRQRWQPVARLTAVALCAGLAGLPTYLSSMIAAKSSWRGTSQINNDQFLTVPWSESLNASLPSTLPAYSSWWGYVQPMPVTYIAWFLIPALAFVDWRRARTAWRELTGVALFAIVFLMWAAGPGTVGPLRWPARVLPMLALGLLVLVCVLLSRFGTLSNVRARVIGALVLIGLLWIRTFSADPHDATWHVVAALGIAAAGALVVWVAHTRGSRAAVGMTMLVTLVVAYAQVRGAQPTPMPWHLPADRAAAKAAFPHFNGLTLQLADRGLLQPRDKSLAGAYGSLVFGSYARDLELNYVNGYTPNGHYWFGELMCMRWDSSVCPDAYRRVFAPVAGTQRTLADLLKVDRVVLQRALYPDARSQPPPTGWQWVDYPGHEQYIWVLERTEGPISTVNGRVADAHNVVARSVGESNTSSRVTVTSAEGGRVIFARLAWPGYRVSLNGRQIPFTTVGKSILAVDIPAGTSGAELDVTWRPPGWKIDIVAVLAGLAGLGGLLYLDRRTRRPGSPEGHSEPAAVSS